MGLLDRKTGPTYSPVPDDRSAGSADNLLYDGHQFDSDHSRSRSSHKKLAVFTVGSFLALLVYSALLVTATSMYWKKERIHGANVIECMYCSSMAHCVIHFLCHVTDFCHWI